MANIVYAIYLSQMIPMLMSLPILKKGERLVVGYMLIGSTVCLVASELNGVLFPFFGDMLTFCTTISPITEEILKAIPILCYAFYVSDNRTALVQISFAVGLGFAILENSILIVQNIHDVNVAWAFIRGIGAGLMHSICTVAVGIGMTMVHKRRKMFVCGTTALLFLAITYHAIYNTIVMSDYKYLGFAMPLMAYIPINIVLWRKSRERNIRKHNGIR